MIPPCCDSYPLRAPAYSDISVSGEDIEFPGYGHFRSVILDSWVRHIIGDRGWWLGGGSTLQAQQDR